VQTLSPSRVVWTGFEPFGSHDYNPSWDVARAASGAMRPDVPVEAERLPVDFSFVRRWAAARLSDDPLLAIHLGLAESRSTIDIEVVARNRVGDRLDESGQLANTGDHLLPSATSAFDTPFPAETFSSRLADVLHVHGLPEPAISESAGSYVCNALYFHSLRQLVGSSSNSRPESASVFIHIPPVDPEDAMRLGAVLGSVTNEIVG
jgi:pyroglutamyl-peptidase